MNIVAYLVTIHVKQVMLQQKDMKLVRSMREIMTGYAWAGNTHQPQVCHRNLAVFYDDFGTDSSSV